MIRFQSALALALVLGAAIAGCGGGQAEGAAVQTPEGSSGSPGAAGTAPGNPDEAHGKSAQPDFHGPMTPIATTSMAGDLQKLGLDIKSLPALSKMDPKTLRKLMRTFTQSLGAKCG